MVVLYIGSLPVFVNITIGCAVLRNDAVTCRAYDTPYSNVSVQFVFMDSMDASGMMGMEQVRSATPLNAMQQHTPQTMMQYGGQ